MVDADLIALRQWVGRCETVEDEASVWPAQALAATLDHEMVPRKGAILPPLWHWLYFKPLARQSGVAEDGHPRKGNFLPPIALPRRMWAGSRVRFIRPILLGESIRRETEIVDIKGKSGRQGELIFLTLMHRVSGPQGLAIEEEQDIVYREAVSGPVARQPAVFERVEEIGGDWVDEVRAAPVLLFRYSALTFNAHRIHYDRPYAIGEEGYPGLVVQGPLTATLLMDSLSRRDQRSLSEFSFRGENPLFDDAPFTLRGRRLDDSDHYELRATGPAGQTAMTATARLVGA